MRSVNRVVILGRLPEPPTCRQNGAKPVCNFELETVETWMGPDGSQTRKVVHTCVAFGPVASTIAEARAGDHIYVEGSMRAERDGGSDYAFEVVCFVAIRVAEPAT